MKQPEFFTTVELLEALRRRENGCTDYRLAKILGLTPGSIRHLLQKGGVMSDETALYLADELDLPPVLVVFSAIRERAKNQQVIDILDNIPASALKAGMFILLFTALSLLPIVNAFALAA